MTLASIVVPSRGGAQRLPRLLAALLAQDDPAWEAIVVLDGDIDDSETVVKGCGDPRVSVITFPENRGRVAALNAGFAAAAGDVLIRCDDDLVPATSYVAAHKARHQDAPAGVVGLYLNHLPPTHYARVYGNPADAQFRQQAYGSSTPWRYWAGNASVTRALWEQVGPYDPDYRAYGWEDVDWGYRLQAAGVPVQLAPELETPHYMAATTTVTRVDRAFHSGAARLTFEAKHGTGHLPTPSPGTGAWGVLVRAATASLASRKRLLRAARLVDEALPRVPAPIGRKLVALLVESAGLVGYRHPAEISTAL